VKGRNAPKAVSLGRSRLGQTEVARLTRERDEALAQQAATADVLQTISSSPGNLDTVLETILANATRLCEANFGVLLLYEGAQFRVAAAHNPPPAPGDCVKLTWGSSRGGKMTGSIEQSRMVYLTILRSL
jgi:hypothetical protein